MFCSYLEAWGAVEANAGAGQGMSLAHTRPGSDAARGTSNYRVSRNGLTFSLGTRRSALHRRPRSPTR